MQYRPNVSAIVASWDHEVDIDIDIDAPKPDITVVVLVGRPVDRAALLMICGAEPEGIIVVRSPLMEISLVERAMGGPSRRVMWAARLVWWSVSLLADDLREVAQAELRTGGLDPSEPHIPTASVPVDESGILRWGLEFGTGIAIVCDESGRSLGIFTSAEQAHRLFARRGEVALVWLGEKAQSAEVPTGGGGRDSTVG